MPTPVASPAAIGHAGPGAARPAPPRGEVSLAALTDRCVQCGLCLPACPTYGRSALEAESPRGRIALVRAWELGTVPPTPAGDAHLDHCLGCRSCEAVCPAGVEYGQLLVHARVRQRERRPPGWRERLVLALAARPRPLAVLLGLYRRFHPWLPGPLRLLPRPPASRSIPAPDTHPGAVPTGPSLRLTLFSGCVAETYEAPLRQAVAKLCAAAGARIDIPAGQACCGAMHAHAGDLVASQRLAAGNRNAFAGADAVLTLASGCHESVAQSLAALPYAPAVQDAIAWLTRHGEALRFSPTPRRVALHLPCTQRNVVGSVADLRHLLRRVPQLEVVELDAGFGCCGAAGLQMLTEPDAARDYRAPLLEQFQRSGASVLLSANIGCRLHLAQGVAQPVEHPLEFLASVLVPDPPPARSPVKSGADVH